MHLTVWACTPALVGSLPGKQSLEKENINGAPGGTCFPQLNSLIIVR